jgi:hypothetical protein
VGSAEAERLGVDRQPDGRQTRVTPPLYNDSMSYCRTDPTHRACCWCAAEFAVVRRPGRPRLYCNHACRQRATSTATASSTSEPSTTTGPGQRRCVVGYGYEQGGSIAPVRPGTRHADQRPSGRRRRETLVRLAGRPVTGQYFSALHPRACGSCTSIAEKTPLRYGISPSNELSRLRSLFDDMAEARVPPADGDQLDSGELSVGARHAQQQARTRARGSTSSRHTLHLVVRAPDAPPTLRGRPVLSAGYHRFTSSFTVLTSTLR